MQYMKYLCLAGLFILISSCSSNKKNGPDTAGLNPTGTSMVSNTPEATLTPTMTPTNVPTQTAEAENDWVNRPNFMAGVAYQVVRSGADRLMAFEQSKDPNDPHTLKTYAYQENGKWRWDEVVEANHTDVIGDVQGVQVGVTITIDQSLTAHNPDLLFYNVLEDVNLNPGFNNSMEEDSAQAITYVAAEAIYNAWHDNGPGGQIAARKAISFEAFMKMWKDALEKNSGWDDLKTTVYADDLASDGYQSEPVEIVPGDITVVVLDPSASTQIVRRIRPARVTQDRMEEEAGKSMGTHVENGKLVIWMTFPESFYRGESTFASSFALALDRISWGSGNQDYVVADKFFDRSGNIAMKRLANILPGNIFPTAFELMPQSIATTTPAPTPVLTFHYDSEDHSPEGIYAVLIKKIRDTATFLDDGTNIADALMMQFSVVNECSRSTCFAFDDEGTLHVLHSNEEVSALKSQNKKFVLLQTPMDLVDVQILGYLYNGWQGFNHRLIGQGIKVSWLDVPTEWMPGAAYYLSFELATQDQIIPEWLPAGYYYVSVTGTDEIFLDVKDIPNDYYGSKNMKVFILPHSMIPASAPKPAAAATKTP